MAKWTLEKVSELDDSKLKNLLANAERLDAGELLDWCKEELSKRGSKAKRSGRAARPDDERNAESEAAAQLQTVARDLEHRYDLSATTAKNAAKDMKGFRALEILGKNGSAKVGGLQLNGALSLERYISYRWGEDKLVLAFVLLRDQPVEQTHWIVVGPSHLLPDGQLITDQLDGLSAVPKAYVGETGRVSQDFSEASSIFTQLVESIAPVRENCG